MSVNPAVSVYESNVTITLIPSSEKYADFILGAGNGDNADKMCTLALDIE